MKKIFSILLTICIVFNMFVYNTNAAGINIPFDYSNFNGNQELKISGNINDKIDSILLKKFSGDYYNQFNFLKTLNKKVFALGKNISIKQKPIIDELKNYLSLKGDFIYKKSMIDDSEKLKKLENIFKKSFQTKGITINKVIENINNENIITISNKNNNFENLTKEDFIKIVDNLIDEVKINKYETSDEILSNSKEITVEDFKKIKDILPSNLFMKDEFGNTIRGEIKEKGIFFSSRVVNSKLTSILNEKLESFGNLTKDKLNSEVLLSIGDIYNVLEDNNLIINYLSSIKPIGKITSDKTEIIGVEEIKKDNILKGYMLAFENPSSYRNDKTYSNDILDYGNIKISIIGLYIFFDKNGNIKYYLTIPTNKYIYLGIDKYKEKQYMVFDLAKKQISFIKEKNGKNYYTSANINIIFEDNYKIDNNNDKLNYSLEDFKEILNKKIVRINIDGEDITNSELIQKGNVINTLK